MDIEEIKTLTDLMVRNDLAEIMIRDGEKRVFLRRGAPPAPHLIMAAPTAVPVSAMTTANPVNSAASAPAATAEGVPPLKDEGCAKITSPMVGTFYAAPNPEAPPFVRVGDKVNPESVVCIIEAMKVFNEIKAEVSGVVESIEVETGHPVEFGQTIMTVRVR